ncbi:hypothetical protein LGQ03_07360 [Loktanella sp. TSTF-M6]|uniref:Uncharacterized protein n=1 Tax=Loktanella gaetbuli TaxID=2881335 RepID=A0ABS8BTJ4_9RHOB|nr:hypothetical protein [Loktanella gaetbuli]MCB5199054.1 hypothetical protein [Loktanella gaetbuli]
MRSYTDDEKKFMTFITEHAVATNSNFARLASDHFFTTGSRPIMLVIDEGKRVLLLCSKGKFHDEFYKFINYVALMEELESERLIIRIPQRNSHYFVGELGDSYQRPAPNGATDFISPSTGNFIRSDNFETLQNLWSTKTEALEIIEIESESMPDLASRLSNAFSSVVYPRETLVNLVRNKFRNFEEIRHRETMTVAIAAISVTILFSTISLILSTI